MQTIVHNIDSEQIHDSAGSFSEKEDEHLEKIAELIQMKENAEPIPDGILVGDVSLQNLHTLIDNVFIPMLVAADRSDKGVMVESAKSPLQQVGSISIIEFMNSKSQEYRSSIPFLALRGNPTKHTILFIIIIYF